MKHSRFIEKNISHFAAILALSSAVLCSCATKVEPLPAGMTSREIVQKAQSAYDNGNTKAAEVYYRTLLSRFSTDTAIQIEGTYEIAHIYIKQKKYEQAVPMLKEIITVYENVQPGTLPASYQKLAKNDLAKVPESYLNQNN